MKKILTVLLVIICALLSASCSDNTSGKNKPTDVGTTTAAASEKTVKKAVKGIDVSSYSGNINWKKVKKSGISFAIIRIGGRGYGESGSLYIDKNALTNIDNAQKYGIDVGAYFFSQAVSESEALEEAEFTVKTLAGRNLNLPIAYDVEKIKNDTSRVDKIKYSDSVKFAKVFMTKIKSSGYEAMAYIGEDSILKEKDFKDYKIWLARYGKPFDSGYEILQYSKSGRVKGINGSVDLDVIYQFN